MTIKVYPSLLPGEPIETFEWHGTFGGWLDSKRIPWRSRKSQPIRVEVNGVFLPEDEWLSKKISSFDDVCVRPIPQGGLISGIADLLGGILDFAFGWLFPSAPKIGETQQGRSLDPSQAKANQARLGDAVPELAGRYRRFPDYLVPPHRKFVTRREQWLEFIACIGPGYYDIDPDDIKIGETPISSLGDNAEVTIYQPGDDLSADSAHEHWHSVEEVGGTSSGTAGLELSTELGNRINTNPASYTFLGNTITRSEGEYPPAWGGGTFVRVEYPRVYDVQTVTVYNPSDPGDYYFISEITGFFGHVPLAINQPISIGPYTSLETYIVSDIAPGVGGVASIRLRTNDSNLDPVVFPANPAATLIFGADIEREISMISPLEITLDGPEYFETGTSASATVTFSGGAVYGEWTSEFVAVPGNEKSTTYELDVFFPSGLGVINNDGNIGNRTVRIEVERRDIDTNFKVSSIYTYTDNTLDDIGITETITTVTPSRLAFRMRRASAESTSTSVRDNATWYGLKSKIAIKSVYPDWTTVSLKLRSGGHIGAQSENKFNIVATRILPELQSDGTWSAPVPTRDISAFVRYVAHSIGYTDDNIDMDALSDLHNIWKSRNETADYVFSKTTVKDAINTVLGAGMAQMTVSRGQIRPVREGIRTHPEQSYSLQNMRDFPRRNFSARGIDEADGVEVEYTDADTWTQQTVICSLPGSQRLKLEKLSLPAVTDRTRAWRIGMRRAREIAYRRWEYSFSTELDAMNSEYGSYIAIFDDLSGYGQSMLMVGIEPHADGAKVTVNEPLVWAPGESHIIGFRKPDGTLSGPWPAVKGDDDFTIIAAIPEPFPAVTLNQELPHVYFGKTSQWSFPALVRKVSVRGLESASVTAVNHDNRIYEDDDNSPSE